MKLPESLFSRMLLAYLPFMVYPYDLFRMGAAALWVAVFLWVTVAFFWLTRRLFPDRFLKHAFFLWLIAWAQAVWTLTKLPPYWIVSVFFLTPVSFLGDTEGPSSPNPPINLRVGWDCPGSQINKLMESQGRLPFWKRKKKFGRYFFDRLLAGTGFVGFVILLALVREIGERHLGIRAFEQPAGALFMAAAVAFLWKNQPYGKHG